MGQQFEIDLKLILLGYDFVFPIQSMIIVFVPGTFSCINARDKYDCMQLLERDEADIVNLDAEDLYLAGRLYALEPFIVEEFNGNKK
ncbi:unnamed protein product [Medioppia subpectinata]|uniref:Transferrin-like domain-containing protein n=1 Tax=Medioppia subpectinata TaxID=1979941 RepID=A0A7R9KP13_9ACAR|nr:unnamed protein product [Medioppia subpectinata]CAG2107132.1 unnamed protein product [Medioppia subpectinata]